MRPVYWKLASTLVAGALIGTFGGQATIAGMAPPPTHTIADRPYYAAETLAEPAQNSQGAYDTADYAQIADACTDCSDYDLGFRFAAARRVTESTDCMDFTWSYQRGCLAYLRRS